MIWGTGEVFIQDLIQEVQKLPRTKQNDKGFGSSDKISCVQNIDTPSKTFATINNLLSNYSPTMLKMSTNPYENELTHTVQINGKHPTLGLELDICPTRQLPKLTQCCRGTPSAKIPKWRSTIWHSYVIYINDFPVTTINDIITKVKELRNNKAISTNIAFSTIHKMALHPDSGVPQLYFDRLHSISQHISDIKNNKDTINKLHGLTCKYLQKQDDWDYWNKSKFYQLDCYHAQNVFSEPLSLPTGANCLPLL